MTVYRSNNDNVHQFALTTVHHSVLINLIETVSMKTTQNLQYPQSKAYREFPDVLSLSKAAMKSICMILASGPLFNAICSI